MWRDLNNLANLISPDKWERLRKHKFKVRFKEGNGNHWFVRTLGNDFRIGKLYDTKYHNGYSVNVVPQSKPEKWITSSTNKLEIFISENDWLIKIAPLILSE